MKTQHAAQHSPLPWHIQEYDDEQVEIVTSDGEAHIAFCSTSLIGLANSRFITEACNSDSKNELGLANMQKEQNWAAYQEALRLLNKAEAKAANAERLAEACKLILKGIDSGYLHLGINDQWNYAGVVAVDKAREALAQWEAGL